jgi:hypothetical protein
VLYRRHAKQLVQEAARLERTPPSSKARSKMMPMALIGRKPRTSRFVARTWLPNTIPAYKQLYGILGKARDGGLVDWDAIDDRTRRVHVHRFWNDPSAIIANAARRAGQGGRPFMA